MIFKVLSIIICFLVLFLVVTLVPASAADELTVTQITRIMHPAVMSSNIFNGSLVNAWNRDFTRIMMYENPQYSYQRQPRRLVWGFIDASAASAHGKQTLQVAAAGTYEEYAAAARPVVDTSANMSWPLSAHWSPLVGEENIIYATFYKGAYANYLVKINVDTDTVTPYINLGTIPYGTRCYNWTSDNKLFCSKINEDWSSGGWEIDVQSGTKINIDSNGNPPYYNSSNACQNTETMRWPSWKTHAHHAKNPSGNLIVNYYQSDEGIYDLTNCSAGKYANYTAIGEVVYPRQLSHFSWSASDDWFIVDDRGESNGLAPGNNPSIEWFSIYQMWPDGTIRELITKKSAQGFYPDAVNNPSLYVNFQARPLPSLRKDGMQILFTSTDGKYSYEDYINKGVTPWGFPGFFLVDLAPVDGFSTCTSFTYSAWSECQPNNTQTRTVIASYPSGCTGGSPDLVQSCVYNPGAPAHTIMKTSNPPVIDGNLGEYATANSLSFSNPTGGNTVTVSTLWDEEAIYIGIDVADTQLNGSVTARDGSVWSEDSVEWFIDTYYDGGGSVDPNSAFMRPDDYQGIVNVINTQYDAQGTIDGLPSGSWNGLWDSAVSFSGTLNNNSDSDTGYTVEIRIPWTSIGYTSAPSYYTTVGMSFAINDNDSSGLYNLMWPDITTAAQNASKWKTVQLSGSLATVDTIPPAPPLSLMIQ